MNLADLKYAARLLAKSPWFTLLTVVVLAGGLGISLYTFAALNTLIYRDLPLPESGSIVRIGTGAWPNIGALDAFELAEIRREAESLGELGVYRTLRSLVGDTGESRSIQTVASDWRIFEFSRVPPLLGRGFVRDDSSTAGEPVAVLGYATWQSVFSGDPDVVGKLVRINGRATRVVGVMPIRYAFPVNTGIWLPLGAQELAPAGYSGNALEAYARLRPGVSAEAAEAELDGLLHRIRAERPEASDQVPDTVSILSFQERSWGPLGPVVFGVLNLLSLSILLLATVNIGNLLLARTNARINEIGVRVALGAPRLRLIVQTALENVILCAIGGALAILLAARTLEATDGFMRALLGDLVPFHWTWRLDREVVAVAGVLLSLTVLVVSVLPAWSVSRADPNALLKDDARGGSGLRTGRISRALVTLEVALISGVMLVGSIVTVIAQRAAHYDWGIDTANLFMLAVDLPAERYATTDERLSFYERLLTELRATPGIDAAGVIQQSGAARFAVEGAEYSSPDDRPGSWLVVLSESPSPIGPTLMEGRAFDGRDSATGQKTALVSRTLASMHWPNESPLGRQIEVSIEDAEAELRVIVGVVGDVSYDPVGMTPMGLSAIYVPLPQHVLPSTLIAVRHLGEDAQARSAMYEALAHVDPTIAPDIRTYDSVLGQLTLFARTITKLFAACGAFAILLAITGIYGISSNAVVLRTHEIGLRRALGASNRGVVALFVAQSTRQLAVGLVASALLSVAALLIIQQSFSVGMGTLALIGSGVVLVVSASVLLSIYVSVRGVIRLEPSVALRHG